jgi:hypothetical protein
MGADVPKDESPLFSDGMLSPLGIRRSAYYTTSSLENQYNIHAFQNEMGAFSDAQRFITQNGKGL